MTSPTTKTLISKSSTIYSWADTIICNNRNYHFSMILHVTVVHATVVHVIVVHAKVVYAKVVHVTVVHAKVVYTKVVHVTVVHVTVVHVTVVHAKVVHATVVMYVHVLQRVHMICNIVLTSIRESCTTWHQNVG